MSALSSKRDRRDDDDDGEDYSVVLFISVAEEPYFYCFSIPAYMMSEEDLSDLHMSVPSARAHRVVGCVGLNDTEKGDGFDRGVWTQIPEDEVVSMRRVARVVLGFYYE